MIKLQRCDDPSNSIKLNLDSISIGRDASNRLVLDEPSISDFHAEIIHSGGQLYIIDLLSAAGTFVNEERISGRHLLHAWDRIRLGSSEWQVNDSASCSPDEWALYVQSDLLSRQFFPLKARTVIGRDTSCDIVIENNLLSRQHTELLIEEDCIRVRDLNSRNGSYLNGERVSEACAYPGDVLCFDQESFILRGPSKLAVNQAGAGSDSNLTALRAVPGTPAVPTPAVSTPAVAGRDDAHAEITERVAALHSRHFESGGAGQDDLAFANLSVISGPLPVQQFDLCGETRIGRGADNDVVLAERSVSKRHAVIICEDERWFIEDLDSTNGVKVNDKPCKRCELHDQDEISISRIVLLFELLY